MKKRLSLDRRFLPYIKKAGGVLVKKQMGAYVSLAAAMAIVGSSVVVGKLMVERIPVFLSSGLRFLIASVVLLTLLFCIEKGLPALTKKDVLVLLVQSFTGVFLFSICLLYGVQYTTGTESGILTSTTPMVIGILSFFLLREKIEKKTLIGILLAVCGVMAINLFGAGSQDGTPHALFGNMLIIAAVIGEALFTLMAKLLSPHISALAISTFVSLFGFLFFLPFALFEASSFDYSVPTVLDWSYVLYYALFVTVLAFYLWYSGVTKVPAGVSGIFTSVLPVSAVILSGVILKEPFEFVHFIGIACVIGGIFVTVIKKKQPDAYPAAEEKTL
ncbi:DMT family transporter [Bacillus subtilis]|uniref:DMT family transporter n=1 Tax=Bacillus subtilis TaxID=1423 RepID=UPI000E75EC48|nr:DMT family transporter [Bacillus subtilis]RJS54625.1 EamA family transporter [Bacillus subtilis]WBC24396.1 DMT family transporter [Bacillus subtilis]